MATNTEIILISTGQRGVAQWIKNSLITQGAGVQTMIRQRFFNSEKIISTPILSVNPALCTLSLSQWLGVTLETCDMLWERKHSKNPSSTISEANTNIREEKGGKKVLSPQSSIFSR